MNKKIKIFSLCFFLFIYTAFPISRMSYISNLSVSWTYFSIPWHFNSSSSSSAFALESNQQLLQSQVLLFRPISQTLRVFMEQAFKITSLRPHIRYVPFSWSDFRSLLSHFRGHSLSSIDLSCLLDLLFILCPHLLYAQAPSLSRYIIQLFLSSSFQELELSCRQKASQEQTDFGSSVEIANLLTFC